MDDTIRKHMAVWRSKPALRAIYHEDIFKLLIAHMVPGPALEIGGGPGFLKAAHPRIISSDIVPRGHLDLACDAHHLPFADSTLSNLIGVDVIHHFLEPQRVLEECCRVLSPGGRIVLSEPWITPVSRLVYKHFHHEDCAVVDDPFTCAFPETNSGKDPWVGNAMIPYLLFGSKGRNAFRERFPGLMLKACKPTSTLAYPLTRGFQSSGIHSEGLIRFILKLERMAAPLLTPIMAFRALLVLQKSVE